MRRIDLRYLKGEMYGKLGEYLDNLEDNETMIFMFEIGDFSPVEKTASMVLSRGLKLVNSIRFNEVDWTLVVKKDLDTLKEWEEKQRQQRDKESKAEKTAEDKDKDDQKRSNSTAPEVKKIDENKSLKDA